MMLWRTFRAPSAIRGAIAISGTAFISMYKEYGEKKDTLNRIN
jgi:hypothetical protein